MIKKLGIVMNAIDSIQIKKDSTLAMLFEAANRNYEIFYFEQKDLFVRDAKSFGNAKVLEIRKDSHEWFSFKEKKTIALSELDIILMRVDPPFDLEYIYTTYILELAEREGVLVVNKPQSLRDCNEKFFVTEFPECSPTSLITRNIALLKKFLIDQKDIVCKPLDGMGGSSIFRLQYPDQNASVVFEVLTKNETSYMIAQQYIPEIINGDKRIILINGEPIPFALARIPAANELRGNLAAGATGLVQPLTKNDEKICKRIGPVLREKGLIFVGIDVIGDYLTEINITSPTGIRQIDEQCNINISENLFDCLESRISSSRGA